MPDIETGDGYVIKDSGKRQEFESGARRDTQDGKPRYDLIPPEALRRLAVVYEGGLQKYGENNWTKGMPTTRYLASAMRHMEAYRAGKRDEDHLAQAMWNIAAMIHFEDTGWNDLFDWTPAEPPEPEPEPPKKRVTRVAPAKTTRAKKS
jgi:hypothetical protein